MAIDAPGAGHASGLGTIAQDINANGDVVGIFTDSNNVSHGFVMPAGGQSITTFDAPSAGTTAMQGTGCQGINASGVIVGSVIDRSSQTHGYIRNTGGSFTVFDVPGALGTFVSGINDDGMVTGYYLDVMGPHGYVRTSDGTITTFDPPGTIYGSGAGSAAARINSSGVVVGNFTGPDQGTIAFRGFVRASDGTITSFDAPGAYIAPGFGTVATDINTNGVIVGNALALPLSSSFVRDAAGNFTVFNPPGIGPTGSDASGINDSGVVVGTFQDQNSQPHGYIRNLDASIVIIDDPQAPSGGTIVNHVNAAGAVVGFFVDAAHAYHGFARQVR